MHDCLDILNQNPNTKNGFYWVKFDKDKAKKVWCDMETDGGGYMLIGHMNDPETWDVPSSSKPVEPFGDPHWSSEFGDISILDFRIQVASDEDFKKTNTHWAYRLKNKRFLKNLMIFNKCSSHFPGIGDISYVKDLMADEIMSKEFSCSIFGAYSHPAAKTGWTMMNSCLEKPCPNGFAYHSVFPFQLDYSGGFSYVTSGNNSKSSGGSTTFFGCDNGKCCACYGPPGGKGVYCLKECKATNGGTITKHASAWFWVRLNPPRKVWEKCMEYKSEEENGESTWYKLVGDRNIPVKGRCGKSEPLLNDGVVVLDSSRTLNELPAVSGLLAYRKDNQSLYLKKHNSWEALADESALAEINRKLEKISARLDRVYPDALSCKILGNERPDQSIGIHFIGGSVKVYCDPYSGWTLVARFSNNDAKNWINDVAFWYDRIANYGHTLNPFYNEDMISEAFWKIPANEFKITRSDDPFHAALLETTSNCLDGKTFRAHVTSFGEFRNQTAWAKNACRGSCTAKYGGLYQNTTGFEMHNCSGDLQRSNFTGFWCHWDGDGAVIMIGGGGPQCKRADQGIGITEADEAIFGSSLPALDFGYDSIDGSKYKDKEPQKNYALNLWVR